MKQCPACKTEINAAASICPHCRTKQPASKAKKIVYAILFGTILLTFGRACSITTPPEPPPPKNGVDLSIMRTLVTNKITCGDFNWTLNSGQTSEYTLNCSNDGKTWTTYTIWPNIQKISVK